MKTGGGGVIQAVPWSSIIQILAYVATLPLLTQILYGGSPTCSCQEEQPLMWLWLLLGTGTSLTHFLMQLTAIFYMRF